jgi:hypothetical protein
MTIEEHVIQEPAWIKALVEDVLLPSMHPYGFIGPLGYRWWEPENPGNSFDGWQIAVFPTPNELRGPHPDDGCLYVNGFRLDVGKILSVLSEVQQVAWNSPTAYQGDLDGPELSLQGSFAGKVIWLRFFQIPPPDERPAYYVNPVTGEAWEKRDH